jgi:hypothetical protein
MGDTVKGKLFPRSYVASRDQLFIISCVGRALPLPREEDCETTREEFLATVTSPTFSFEDKEDDPASMSHKERVLRGQVLHAAKILLSKERISERFSRRLAKVHPNDTYPFSGSACLGYKRSEGGRGKDLTKYFPPFSKRGSAVLTVNSSKSRSDWIRVTSRRYGQRVAKPAVADSAIVAVKERGYKVRIVTKNDPYRVARAHVFRRILYPMVTRHDFTIKDEPPNFIPWKRLDGKFCFSGDLKKATDTFSFTFLRCLCMRLGLDTDFVFTNFTVEGRPTKRGAFMGLPLSWTLLDFTHHLICRVVDPSGQYMHKGDDIFAYWTKKQINLWKHFCRMVGFEVNVKKSFKSPDGGTFCEAFYLGSHDGFRKRPVLSVKSFVTSGNVDRFSVIGSISDQAFKRGVSPTITNKLLGLHFPRELRFAKKEKLPIYLPCALGGLGMIPENPSRPMTLKESMWYWGVLEKDMPSLHLPQGLTHAGPLYKVIRGKMDKVVYRSSLRNEDRCPHFEEIVGANFERASVTDLDLKEKRIAYTTEKMRLLKRFRRCVHLVQNPNPTLWKVSRKTDMGYTKKSVDKLLPHRCEGVK